MMRVSLLLMTGITILSHTLPANADAFDNYSNTILAKVPTAAGVKEIKQLTPELIADHTRVLPNTIATFIVVKTNDGRWSKLLVQAAHQKVSSTAMVPIMLFERFVTYREGTEQAIQVSGKNVRLFHNFEFNLDIGQVVPSKVLTSDLRFIADGKSNQLEVVGKAKMYLVTKALPEATPKKTEKLVIGAKFEAKYFNGSYKLYDDGRRSGTLVLKVGAKNAIAGSFYSDKDGQKYEVVGKIGNSPHSVQFTVIFPRSRQVFQGWMFTGDGKAIAGSSRLQERDTGFYALRLER